MNLTFALAPGAIVLREYWLLLFHFPKHVWVLQTGKSTNLELQKERDSEKQNFWLCFCNARGDDGGDSWQQMIQDTDQKKIITKDRVPGFGLHITRIVFGERFSPGMSNSQHVDKWLPRLDQHLFLALSYEEKKTPYKFLLILFLRWLSNESIPFHLHCCYSRPVISHLENHFTFSVLYTQATLHPTVREIFLITTLPFWEFIHLHYTPTLSFILTKLTWFFHWALFPLLKHIFLCLAHPLLFLTLYPILSWPSFAQTMFIQDLTWTPFPWIAFHSLTIIVPYSFCPFSLRLILSCPIVPAFCLAHRSLLLNLWEQNTS